MPIRLRLVLWFGSIFAFPLIVLGIVAPSWLGAELSYRYDEALRAAFSMMVREGVDKDNFVQVAEDALDAVRSNAATVELLSADGKVLAQHGVRRDYGLLANNTAVLDGAKTRVRHIRSVPLGEERTYRIVTGPTGPGRGTPLLVIGSPLSEIERAVDDIRGALMIGIPIVIILAVLGIWVLTRSALRPITDMVERARVISMDRLNDRVAEPRGSDELGTLAKTLNEMLARIEQGVLERQRLIADASHELRTPPTMVRFELELLRETLREDRVDASGLQRSLAEAQRMSSMIDNLLTFARFEGDGVQLLPEEFDLTEEAHTVADRFAAASTVLGIEVTVQGRAGTVTADRERIDQVIGNLIANALQHAGGADVRIELWRTERIVGLSVTDSGPGMTETESQRIFQRAERLPSARPGKFGGNGLGLAICRMIIEAHEGKLWVDSSPGHGSTFSFTLPL